eukprot:4879005-Pyramimonas_sp.AAC.1
MSDASATKSIAEASKEQRGDLSYHYFHTEKGDAPVAAPKQDLVTRPSRGGGNGLNGRCVTNLNALRQRFGWERRMYGNTSTWCASRRLSHLLLNSPSEIAHISLSRCL